MRIGEISFCDKVGYNIRSDETKKFILDTVEKKYGLKIIAKHFEKQNERTLNVLNQNPHLACVRSNGNPYFMYVTRYNHNDLCIFIDKKIQQGYFLPRMIIVHTMFGKDCRVHDDTIIDGEMVKTKEGKWLYLMNDMLVFKGEHLNDTNLIKRLNMLYDLLGTDYVEDDMSPFSIAIKRFFNYDELKTTDVFNVHVRDLNYTCRGVYFKPLFLKFKDILINFDDSLVKKVKREKIGGTFMMINDNNDNIINESNDAQSPPSRFHPPHTPRMPSPPPPPPLEHTNNHRKFMTRKTGSPDVYELLKIDGSVEGTAYVPTLMVSKKMRLLFENKTLVDKLEIQYVFNEKFSKWSPVL